MITRVRLDIMPGRGITLEGDCQLISRHLDFVRLFREGIHSPGEASTPPKSEVIDALEEDWNEGMIDAAVLLDAAYERGYAAGAIAEINRKSTPPFMAEKGGQL